MDKIELIKASAGSGKTHALVNRLSEKIKNGISPERVLATTFTVKAASELRSRIRQKLREDGKSDRASQVLDGLIGTVNSVCGRLLNEYAIEAGLSPALDVLPEENATPIFNAATDAEIAKYIREKRKDLEDVAARLSLNPLKENPHGETHDWKKDVRTVLALARSNRIDADELETCRDQAITALKELFPDHDTFHLSLDDIEKQIQNYQNYAARGKATKDTVKNIQDFLRFPTWAKAARFANANYAKTIDLDFPIDFIREIGSQVMRSKELYADMCSMIRGVFDCAARSLEAYAKYKKAFGLVDFIDQETNVFDLLENNPNFARQMKERLSLIMVDEFQDTSPIQLALFLKLHKCSPNGSVWVGDPKQAIYGFRGTAPELMEALAREIPASNCTTLPYSWRSKKTLVQLSNAIFTRTFPNMPKEEVELQIPPDREKEAEGGIVEAWHLPNKKEEYMRALASGIAELIRSRDNDKDFAPNQICVLFRKNSACSDLAAALAKWNISASAPSGNLLDTLECQLVMSAFRYCINPSDTTAMATLLALYGETPDWLEQLHQAKAKWLAKKGKPGDKEERDKEDFLSEIRELDFLKNLQKKADATPMEILEYVITSLKLDGKVSAMDSPERRLSNVDELRRLCAEYMQQALLERRTATPSGFVATLNSTEPKQAVGSGPYTVNVMTYHKAKGLEWPIVILGSLDADEKYSAFEIRAMQSGKIDINSPLSNRTIHYWPWPFDKCKKLTSLEEALAGKSIQRHAEERATAEGKRLLYVGLTRARERVIFALNRKQPTKEESKKNPDAADTLLKNWLDSLASRDSSSGKDEPSGEPFLSFPMEEGPGELTIGTERIPMETKIFEKIDIKPLPSPDVLVDKPRSISKAKTVPARLQPSEESCTDGEAKLLCKWNYKSAIRCAQKKRNLLGNAFHSFIAMNPQRERRKIAERLLKNWTVEGEGVSPETLLECADNLYRWIAETYPEAKISCEVPMTCHNEDATLYQGCIDMLLELPDGFVIIDHKTHLAESDAEKYAAGCAGQLRLYRKAVENATGRKVKQTIIHLPNLGMCFEVK